MMDIEKLKKSPVMSRRMYLINYTANKMGVDIYYLFGLLNMYNAKNRGKWFWQKAVFQGVLKESFEKFNSFMDKFSQQFRSMDEGTINTNLNEGQKLLEKLVADLETSMVLNREDDQTSVRMYLDDNIKGLIDQSLREIR
jgi:hypothetical protein